MIICVKHDVSWLEVSVYDLHLAQVRQGHDDLGSYVLGQLIVQAALALQESEEAALSAVLCQQVQFVLILKGCEELDDEGVVKVCQDAPLNEHFFHAALLEELVNEHLFESVVGFSGAHDRLDPLLHRFIAALDLIDGSEGTVADLLANREVGSHHWPLFAIKAPPILDLILLLRRL